MLTSITLLSLDYQGFQPLDRVQSTVRGWVDPVVSSADRVTSPVTNAWRSFTEFDDLEEEVAALRAQLGEVQSDSIRDNAAEETLRELLEQLDIDYSGGADTLVAEVIERPGNFESYAVEIDRGSRTAYVAVCRW